MTNARMLLLAPFFLLIPGSALGQAWAAQEPPYGRPDAVVDLRTRAGVALVKGQWKYSDVKIVETDFRAPGPDLKPSGKPTKTYDYTPHAGAADFDDSQWEILDSTTLEARRSGGKLCFNWYRINVTIPDKVGLFDARGSTAVFEVVIDDYAEVWVDGKLPAVYGQSGGPVIKGYNAPNRVVIARDAQPGRKIQLAIFGINGPISASPSNFIWVKSAVLDFYKAGRGTNIAPVETKIVRKDPALDAILTPGTNIEKLAGGFLFTEGPVWDREGSYLLFSDPNNNLIYRWTPEGEVSVYRTHSGYTGTNVGEYGQPGSNGLTLDREGRLTINEHGNRRVTRLEKNGVLTVLADRYQGKRLNSPNDLVYRSDGTLYFTDPPFGLPKVFDDPRKEQRFSGVYRVRDGQVTLVASELTGPNGIAFSPDERFLYVTNWDEKRKVVMRYPVDADGTLGAGSVFFDMTSATGEEALGGMKVDAAGHLFVSGPGGVWVISPTGRHLGTLRFAELPANMA